MKRLVYLALAVATHHASGQDQSAFLEGKLAVARSAPAKIGTAQRAFQTYRGIFSQVQAATSTRSTRPRAMLEEFASAAESASRTLEDSFTELSRMRVAWNSVVNDRRYSSADVSTLATVRTTFEEAVDAATRLGQELRRLKTDGEPESPTGALSAQLAIPLWNLAGDLAHRLEEDPLVFDATGDILKVPGGRTQARPVLPTESRPSAEPNPGSAGLFIGINNFRKYPDAKLRMCVDDAIDLAYAYAHDLRLIPYENVELVLEGAPRKEATRKKLDTLVQKGVLKSESATVAEVWNAVFATADRGRRNGIVIVCFATHGVLSGPMELEYCVAADSDLRVLEVTAVSLRAVLKTIRASAATTKFMMIDACRAINVTSRSSLRTSVIVDERQPDVSSIGTPKRFADVARTTKGMAVALGTTAGGYCYENLQDENGVFTFYFLKALTAAPADTLGTITLGSAMTYVDQSVVAWIRERVPEDELSGGVCVHYEPDAIRNLPLASRP